MKPHSPATFSWPRIRGISAAIFVTLLTVAAMVQATDSGPERLAQLRDERDELLREANRAATAGDRQRGDANFANSQKLNAKITALRAELIKADLTSRQQALTKRLGDLAPCQIWFHDPFLLVVPAHDPEFTKLRQYLPLADRAIYARLGCRNRPATVTIVIAGSDRQGLRQIWQRVTGQDNLPEPERLLPWAEGVIADLTLGPEPLLAGMVRAFLAADFASAPDWLVTSLVTLNETSRIIVDPQDGRTRIEYPVNWRFATLAEANLEPGLPTLKAMLTATDGQLAPGAHPARRTASQLRHWGLWLDRRGWLRPWYETFRDYRQHDPLGISQLEKIAGRSLDQLLAEHEQWLRRPDAE